ncbi:hypothetical protein E2976_17440 [Paracoccus yeei]|uniref:hypothetical protein n=1 Tax=Paracoccus yeei TaxID=147645 RepID=UPI003BF81605
MTDAELITRLRADVDAHVMTGNGGMKRVEAIRLAADRLTQLSEDNERLRSLMVEAKQRLSYDADIFHDQGCWNCGDACLAIVERIDAALAQGQKVGD